MLLFMYTVIKYYRNYWERIKALFRLHRGACWSGYLWFTYEIKYCFSDDLFILFFFLDYQFRYIAQASTLPTKISLARMKDADLRFFKRMPKLPPPKVCLFFNIHCTGHLSVAHNCKIYDFLTRFFSTIYSQYCLSREARDIIFLCPCHLKNGGKGL